MAAEELVSAGAILARKPVDWLEGGSWFDWMHCEILCREADGLMGSVSKEDLATERRDNEPVDQSRAVERKRTSSIELLEESLKLCKAKNGADHPETLASMKKLADSYHKRGRGHVEAKRFHEAIADFDRALELAPRDLEHLYAAATLSLYAGDVERYRGACRVLLDRAEELTAANPQDAAQAAGMCALAPDSVPDFSRVARLAQRSVSGTEKHPNYGLFVLPMGLAEYRCGRHEQAVEWLGRLPPSADGTYFHSSASAAVAMAHHRLGHTDAARRWSRPVPSSRASRRDWLRRSDWHFWMFCELLCREAEGLMGSVGENELRNRRDRELADLSQGVARHPGSPNVLEARVRWLLNHGRFDAADLDYVRLLQLDTKDHWHWYYRACLLAYLGREDEYREHCRAMLSQFADTTDFYTLDRTTKSALLLPDGAGGDVEDLARRAERSLQLSPKSTWSVLLKGLAECRAGRYEPAIRWLEKVSTAPSGSSPDSVTRTVAARAYLSIARHRLGQEAEARAALEQDALEASNGLPSVESGDLSKGGIENWLIAQTALREAEATVLGRRLPDPPQATGPAVPPPPPSPSTPSPFGGKPRAVPGVVQAEDFDEGGEGVAYHDTTYQNLGGRYRRDSVDIDDCADSGGGFNIGGILAGEWLVYTVGVNEAGLYDLDLRLCSPGGGKLHVELGGKDVTGPVEVPRTGWGNWTTVTSKGARLDAGRLVMRVVFDSGGTNAHVCALNWIEARRTGD